MEIWKHRHCKVKTSNVFVIITIFIALHLSGEQIVKFVADLSPQVIVHNAQCTIAHVHLRGGGLSIYRYRYSGESATLQRSSWDWSVFNSVEHLRSVFNSAACGDISPISKQVQSVDDAQLCQIVAFANFHWYQHALIIASVIVWKKKKLEGLLDKFSTPVKFSNNWQCNALNAAECIILP